MPIWSIGRCWRRNTFHLHFVLFHAKLYCRSDSEQYRDYETVFIIPGPSHNIKNSKTQLYNILCVMLLLMSMLSILYFIILKVWVPIPYTSCRSKFSFLFFFRLLVFVLHDLNVGAVIALSYLYVDSRKKNFNCKSFLGSSDNIVYRILRIATKFKRNISSKYFQKMHVTLLQSSTVYSLKSRNIQQNFLSLQNVELVKNYLILKWSDCNNYIVKIMNSFPRSIRAKLPATIFLKKNI